VSLVVMTITTVTACFFPGWRATRADPVRVLRD